MPLRLVAGRVPADALNIGFQNDGAGSLWLAVAKTKWGTIPGKAKDQTCWYSYDGEEHRTSDFKWVASSAKVSLIQNDGSGPPPSATHLGHQDDGAGKLYGAVAESEWGVIPGKAKDNTCWFAYGGEEHFTSDFRWVITEDPPSGAAGEHRPSSCVTDSAVEQLRQLGITEEAGFTDEKLRRLLETSGGDVGLAMNLIFGDQQETSPPESPFPPHVAPSLFPAPSAPPACCICLEEAPDTALVPCGHCLCGGCARELDNCPVCRKRIQSFLRIYR